MQLRSFTMASLALRFCISEVLRRPDSSTHSLVPFVDTLSQLDLLWRSCSQSGCDMPSSSRHNPSAAFLRLGSRVVGEKRWAMGILGPLMQACSNERGRDDLAAATACKYRHGTDAAPCTHRFRNNPRRLAKYKPYCTSHTAACTLITPTMLPSHSLARE